MRLPRFERHLQPLFPLEAVCSRDDQSLSRPYQTGRGTTTPSLDAHDTGAHALDGIGQGIRQILCCVAHAYKLGLASNDGYPPIGQGGLEWVVRAVARVWTPSPCQGRARTRRTTCPIG